MSVSLRFDSAWRGRAVDAESAASGTRLRPDVGFHQHDPSGRLDRREDGMIVETEVLAGHHMPFLEAHFAKHVLRERAVGLGQDE